MLLLKNITKSYTTGEFTQVALNGVNLNFRKNEFVAILGPSGSGKTTCLNIIGGLDRYDSGNLIINGKDTKDFKDEEWDAYRNNSVGFIFQSYNLISHLSIVDNVEMGMTLSGVSSNEKHKRAIEVLDRVGLKDHIHKKPNQLSGGQMQRVAIARALANDPDIILADEPTGALDTQTSVQIMELIKEVAKDKLVIMVTHNPKLANDYADRIVKFQDGEVIEDSYPLNDHDVKSDYALKKTSMSFLTALKISGKNIATKKWRTALTSFASSIGIIGIALILSLSNGFDMQIKDFETNTMSGFPIIITQKTTEMDREAMMEHRNEMLGITKDEDKFPDVDVIYPYDYSEVDMTHDNIFSDDYIDYVESIDTSLISGISYTRIVNMNMLKSDGDVAKSVNTSLINFQPYPENLDDNSMGYFEKNYEVLAGNYPEEMIDLVLIVDGYNRIDKVILDELGINSNSETINFDYIIGHETKIIFNDEYYKQMGDFYTINGNPTNLIDLYNSEEGLSLRIVGIVRANEDVKLEILSPGVAYSDRLSKHFIEDAKESEIVKKQEKVDFNILTGELFSNPSSNPMSGRGRGSIAGQGNPVTKETILTTLGADSTPYMITIYPRDFNTKDEVLKYLDEWNEDKDIDDNIIYTDLAATITNLSSGIMDAITIVLVAFASISLVVSLIMIGIITYISVLERTKEIGVLRALGARKKDITRVFNAETFIIGTVSGLLGIAIAYGLTIPVNMILENMTDLPDIAQLNPIHATMLVVISVVLTMLGGLIPARMAAKKDPVEALRTE